MVLTNIKQIEKEFLEEHYTTIIKKINEFHKNDRGFIMSDLLEKDDPYYRYMTKGILLTLLNFEYIRIISLYNGNKNYVYLSKKEIKIENVNK